MKQVALITGASSGIGRAAAELFGKRGYIVYAAARRMDLLNEFASESVKPISLDVADDQSMRDCVEKVLAAEGRIDVLVNNAGYGSYGAVEDTPLEEARRQFDVNVFGLARMTQLVLPSMREAGRGKIINVTSMGGRVWSPFGAWYHASKFAVEGLSASMRLELEPFGIDVVVIEPGAIATPWGTIAAQHLRETSKEGAYAADAARAAEKLEKRYAQSGVMTKPGTVARMIVKAAASKHPRTRYLLGYGAKPMVYIHKIFGDRVYNRLARSVM